MSKKILKVGNPKGNCFNCRFKSIKYRCSGDEYICTAKEKKVIMPVDKHSALAKLGEIDNKILPTPDWCPLG